MKLDISAIEHLAVLAKLRLTEGEAEVYGRQLTDVLGHLDNLKEAEDFIDQNNLKNLINQKQVSDQVVDLAEDKIASWPSDEVEACLAMTERRVDGEIIMPKIA